MVERQLAARDITHERVLAAMARVPRHEFVPESRREEAYADCALPIGHRATISQPYIVALMTQTLAPTPTDRALEVGTGSGYGAAVLAELVEHVTTIETVAPLAAAARDRLRSYGDRVVVVDGDGSQGHPAGAPYDVISVTAAAPRLPQPLLDQLARDYEGRLKVLTISQDLTGAEAVGPFFARNRFTHLESWIDPQNHVGEDIGGGVMPTTVLYVGSEEVWRVQGDYDWSSEDARAAIDAAIAE